MTKQATTEELETVAIRFAGDSGDGMQLTGLNSRKRQHSSVMTLRHFLIFLPRFELQRVR